RRYRCGRESNRAEMDSDGLRCVIEGDARDSRQCRNDDWRTPRPAHGISRSHAFGNANRRALSSWCRVVIKSFAPSREEVFELLTEIKDPELPVVDIVELGIVRDVSIDGDTVRVDVTPTYSGCPALRMIEDEIVEKLKAHGFNDVKVRNVFSPAWTTDW